MSLSPGLSLGADEILALIGSGGVGEVCRAVAVEALGTPSTATDIVPGVAPGRRRQSYAFVAASKTRDTVMASQTQPGYLPLADILGFNAS